VYATIHLKFEDIKDIMSGDETITESTYQKLKEKTELGSQIAKRLQLAQKCEDIIRAHNEGVYSETFIQSMLHIQPETISQVLLMSDLYVTLREVRSYKRPLNHAMVVKLIEGDLAVYFEERIVERFIKFEDEYNAMFNNL
jgi:response regulator RpfG family c-di-GMP phosphodiesterase